MGVVHTVAKASSQPWFKQVIYIYSIMLYWIKKCFSSWSFQSNKKVWWCIAKCQYIFTTNVEHVVWTNRRNTLRWNYWINVLVTEFDPLSFLLSLFGALLKSHPESKSLCRWRWRKNRETKKKIKKAAAERGFSRIWKGTDLQLVDKTALSPWTVCVFPFGCFTSNGAFQLLSLFLANVFTFTSIQWPLSSFRTKHKMWDVN